MNRCFAAYMAVYHVHAWSIGTGITQSCWLLCGCWESNMDPRPHPEPSHYPWRVGESGGSYTYQDVVSESGTKVGLDVACHMPMLITFPPTHAGFHKLLNNLGKSCTGLAHYSWLVTFSLCQLLQMFR